MNKIKKNPIFILALIILCSITIYSFAKYVIEIPSIHVQSAKQFYFNSDTLQVENPQYLLYDWNGEDTYNIKLNLNNYEDELRYTNEDIEYEIIVTSENENISATTSLENNIGILKGATKSKQEISIFIDSKEIISEGEAIEIVITANSTVPYEKTIMATFIVHVHKSNKYEVSLLDENLQYTNLCIENKEQESNITIKYDNTKVTLDTNNELLEDMTITTEGTQSRINIKLQRNSNYVLGFIKNSNVDVLLGTDIIIE